METRSGRHFALYKRKSHDSQINLIHRRTFGSMYQKSLPEVSKNHELICLPRFSKFRDPKDEDEGLLDIYDCSGSSFWESEEQVDPLDKQHYRYSLEISPADILSFKLVSFSQENKYAAILFDKKCLIYDL